MNLSLECLKASAGMNLYDPDMLPWLMFIKCLQGLQGHFAWNFCRCPYNLKAIGQRFVSHQTICHQHHQPTKTQAKKLVGSSHMSCCHACRLNYCIIFIHFLIWFRLWTRVPPNTQHFPPGTDVVTRCHSMP